MLGYGPLEALAGFGRVDESVEKHLPVRLGKRKRFVFGDGAACGGCKRVYAKLGKLAALKTGGAFDKLLCLFVDAESQALRAGGRIEFRAACLLVIVAPSKLVGQNNIYCTSF